jgi:tetratricopeptide (TPR) repeat protein
MNFDEIINIWQNAERESLSQFAPNKSDNCLTFAQFEQYIQGQYTPDQNQHVQSCAYCQKMIRLFQKYAAETLPTTEKINWLSRLLANWRNNWQSITKGLNELVKPIPVPARLTIVGLAAAIILMLLLIPSEKKYSHLARIEPLYYQSIESRGEESLSESERLFQQGMAFYQQGDYGSAINKLLLVIKKQPEDMNANFYVGLCYLLTKKTDRAIFHLQRIIELNGEFLYEKCYWYLGNAYLMKEDGKKALEMFEKVVAMEGDFEWEAREMIVDIKEISNK